MLKNNVETFLACDKEYNEADIVMFGAPFDSTTSFRPGTRFGPSAIRSESFGIETYSPYQNKDLEDIGVMDIPRYWQYRPVAITEAMDTLVQAAAVQSFIPVVDDGGYFIGIIKRSDIINYCYGRMSEE